MDAAETGRRRRRRARMESVMTSAVTKNRVDRGASGAAVIPRSAIRTAQSTTAVLLLAALLIVPGCARGPAIIAPELRKPIDRSQVECPSDFVFERFIADLT